MLGISVEQILIEINLRRYYAAMENVGGMNIARRYEIGIKTVECALEISRRKSHTDKARVP
jgi:hypothetical protein